jgi:D-alanyl-D-alanine carboxypeptidase (penicillin-binding protein 5/6)
MFLSPNEQVSVENLLKGIVTLSGNDASVVLAECIAGTEPAFTDQMNALGKRIGLTNSHFGTANGWPDNGVTYVTARDLATLARWEIEHHYKLYKQFYSLPSFTWGKTLGSQQDITQQNRNPILGHVAGADGLKTGHTDEAGYGFTGSAEQNGRRLIEVLAGLPSWNARVQESTRLIEWGFNAWQAKPLFSKGARVGTAKVQLGSSSEVPLVAPRNLAVTVPAGLSNGAVQMRIRYDGPLVAPIRKGQEVAQLVVTTGDTAPQIVSLVAGDDVGRAGFFGRIWLGLKSLFGMA